MKKEQTISNQEKLDRLKLRKILWYLIIISGLLVLVFSVFSLITGFTPLPAIICFVLEAVFSKWRNSINPEIGSSKKLSSD